LMFVLGMDADQKLSQLADLGDWHGGAVYVSPGATVFTHRAPQDALILMIKLPCCQPLACRRTVSEIKGSFDLGPLAAGPYHATVGALAEGKTEGVDDDRLACTGFAADDSQPAAGFEFQRVDGGEVADAEVGKHMLSIRSV
jgi:hypothetical protein